MHKLLPQCNFSLTYLEGLNFYRLKSKVYLPSVFKKQLWYFIENIEKERVHTAARKVLWDRFFKKQSYTSEISENLIDSSRFKPAQGKSYLRTLINNLIRDKNKGLPLRSVEIISPYFPSGIDLFNELKHFERIIITEIYITDFIKRINRRIELIKQLILLHVKTGDWKKSITFGVCVLF